LRPRSEQVGVEPPLHRVLGGLGAQLPDPVEVVLQTLGLVLDLPLDEVGADVRAFEQVAELGQELVVVGVGEELDRVELLLLDLLGQGDHAVGVHAGEHQVDAGVLHLGDLDREVRGSVGERLVLEGHRAVGLRAELLEAVHRAVGAFGRLGDRVGQQADLVGAHLVGQPRFARGWRR